MSVTIQAYNDGAAALYSVSPDTPYGKVRADDLTLVQDYLRFCDRKVGMSRFWSGWAAGEKIDRVLRVPLKRGAEIEPGQVLRLYGASARTDVYYTVLQVQVDHVSGWQDLTLGVMQIDQG